MLFNTLSKGQLRTDDYEGEYEAEMTVQHIAEESGRL
jgi:hypothetical protein